MRLKNCTIYRVQIVKHFNYLISENSFSHYYKPKTFYGAEKFT